MCFGASGQSQLRLVHHSTNFRGYKILQNRVFVIQLVTSAVLPLLGSSVKTLKEYLTPFSTMALEFTLLLSKRSGYSFRPPYAVTPTRVTRGLSPELSDAFSA